MREVTEAGFWERLDVLVADSKVVVDRPKGSTHPRFPDFVYPFDYGYLDGTHSGDGEGIDVWLGSGAKKQVTAVICSVDLDKRDSELKVLLGCSNDEARAILDLHRTRHHGALLVLRAP